MTKNHCTNILQDLITQGAIPPFVYCYPPRSTYRPLEREWSIEDIWKEDIRNSLNRDLNLYIHVPFCRYQCGFCNLYTIISTDEDLYGKYVDAICRELLFYREIIQSRNLRTIYIGGGTPSLLATHHFETLFKTISDIYPNWRSVVEEVAIEASPDSIVSNPKVVSELMSLGLTRMNVGIQSLMPGEIKEAGRAKAGVDVVREAIAIIKKAGLPNLSTDLIMGFSGQTDDTWKTSVTELVALKPETISTYFLTVRPDAWFSTTGKYQYYRDSTLYARYDMAREAFEEAGYVQESNVRYKKPGLGGYRQKVLQFRGTPYLGVGAGARTYTNTVDYIVGGSHKPNIEQVYEYIEMMMTGRPTIKAGFEYDDQERIRKRIALDLFDLNLNELDRYNYQLHRPLFEPLFEAASSVGLLQTLGKDRLQLTREGFKYRDIISWAAFSDKVKELDETFYLKLHTLNDRAVNHLGSHRKISGVQISNA